MSDIPANSTTDPIGKIVNVHFLCPQFIPAQTLRKKFDSLKTLCKVQEDREATEVANMLLEFGGLAIYHVARNEEFPIFINFIKSISASLMEKQTHLIIVSKIHIAPIKKLLQRYSCTYVYPTTVLVGDLEKLAVDILKTKSVSLTFGKSPSAGDMTSYTSERAPAEEEGVFFFKGDGASQDPKTEDSAYRRLSPIAESESSATEDAMEVIHPPPRRDLFKLVQNPEQRKLLIADCVESAAPIAVRYMGKNQDLMGLFYQFDEQKNKISCQLQGSPHLMGELQQAFANKSGSKLTLSASLKQSRIFMTAHDFKWKTPQNVELSVPEEIFSVQRRRGLRYSFFPNTNFFAQIGDSSDSNFLMLPIFDLSDTGVALLVRHNNLPRVITREKRLKALRFYLEEHTIDVPILEERHATPFALQNEVLFYRVGFRFVDINEENQRVIANYIYAKSVQYLDRFATELKNLKIG